MIFRVLGALAEFERELIRERSAARSAAARARGRNGGRPTVMTPDKAKAARRMYDQRELTVAQIAEALGVGRSSVYRALWREGARCMVRPAPSPGMRWAVAAELMTTPAL